MQKYYANGGLKEEIYYKDGKKNGIHAKFDINGNCISQKHYKNNEILPTILFGTMLKEEIPDFFK